MDDGQIQHIMVVNEKCHRPARLHPVLQQTLKRLQLVYARPEIADLKLRSGGFDVGGGGGLPLVALLRLYRVFDKFGQRPDADPRLCVVRSQDVEIVRFHLLQPRRLTRNVTAVLVGMEQRDLPNPC